MDNYSVIGLMSGSSLDGLDIACCEFSYDVKWNFTIRHAETVEYPSNWLKRLINMPVSDSEGLVKTHIEFGKYLGRVVKGIVKKTGFRADFIASHGHTIFHRPEKGYTFQIGNGNSIAAITGIPAVYDFRSADVALGGQGAPLVPIGDRLLFGDYPYCLNLGGISNISFENDKKRIAFDICPVNMVLNYLSSRKGLKYDDKGRIAYGGKIISPLLDKLNSLDFYQQDPPKSLGREWVEQFVVPLIIEATGTPDDLLRTFTEHIAFQIGKILNQHPAGKILVTGGGAKNKFLIDRMKIILKSEIVIPETKIVDYKEALIFAFLGILRWKNEINCLSSVTGASRDCCCGVIAHP
jgi:anhydro-N-acetylmuramic acid kinase